MNIHEFQAKELFAKNGVPVPKGYLASSPVEAEFAYRRLNSPVSVVKAQIMLVGVVKLVSSNRESPEEAAKVTEEMIGMNLVTHQTGPGKRRQHGLRGGW